MQQPHREPHLLAIKVMRLSKPAPVLNVPSHFEKQVKSNVKDDCDTNFSIEKAFPLTDLLTVPHQFGNIYLGEKFISYIRISNDSLHNATDVFVKAELQTNTRRVTLSNSIESSASLVQPSKSVDFIVQHEVKELGKHTLVCSVNYTNPNGENMFFRKSFKFIISNPLAVKTKVYNINDVVYLEAQVQNLMLVPMFIEDIKFEANPAFKLTDLNVLVKPVTNSPFTKENEEDSLIPDFGLNTATSFGTATYINSQDIRQYLYRLDPVNKAIWESIVGKMDITWRTTMGEFGRLQTSQLPNKVVPLPEIKFDAVTPKERIVVNNPFSLHCTISNVSEKKMSLRIFADKKKVSNLLLNGISGHYLGHFVPGVSKTFELQLYPVANGLFPVCGLRVKDDISGRIFIIDHLKDVYVHSE